MNIFDDTPFFFYIILLGLIYKFKIIENSYKRIIITYRYVISEIYKPTEDTQTLENIDIKSEPEPIKFENKYIEEYNKLSADYYFSQEEKLELYKKIKVLTEEGNPTPEKEASEFVFREKIKKLQNTFVMENTPMGNVILTFNVEKDHFEYYSDNTIPYRFLETVARKFAIINNCKTIYIDMDEQLKIYEENLKQAEEKKAQEKKAQEQKAKLEKHNTTEVKKNVFAKFKTYNKDITTNRIAASQAIPPKTNQNQSSVPQKDSQEKIILKEKSNNYRHKGKFNNFNILQQIDKSVTNKKLKLSFSDYKKLMNKTKLNIK